MPNYKHLGETLLHLPFALPVIDFYFRYGLHVNDTFYINATDTHRWDVLDILKQYRPKHYDLINRCYPVNMAERHERRE